MEIHVDELKDTTDSRRNKDRYRRKIEGRKINERNIIDRRRTDGRKISEGNRKKTRRKRMDGWMG